MSSPLDIIPNLPPGRVLTPEWEAAFRTWQARLRDYLVEKELHIQNLEERLRAASARVPVTGMAYTADSEGSAYTGLPTGEPASPYASVTDLNALRVAYENLRVAFESLLAKLD